MHDPTEGGVATGLHEMLGAAGLGAVVDEAALPVLPETAAMCEQLGLEPLGLIASGALLASVAPQETDASIAALAEAGIKAAVIGRVREDPGVVLKAADGRQRPLRRFARDEIARLFES
jgi:hydrogenase maturation factor